MSFCKPLLPYWQEILKMSESPKSPVVAPSRPCSTPESLPCNLYHNVAWPLPAFVMYSVTTFIALRSPLSRRANCKTVQTAAWCAWLLQTCWKTRWALGFGLVWSGIFPSARMRTSTSMSLRSISFMVGGARMPDFGVVPLRQRPNREAGLWQIPRQPRDRRS